MGLSSHLYVPDSGRSAFVSVTVSIDCRLKKTIRWKVRPSFQDRDGYFRVERSIQNAPWEQVGNTTDDLFLETSLVSTQEPDRETQWRVVLIGKIGEYASEPIPEGFHPSFMDLQYAHAIYRREYLTLTRYSGIKGCILHKRQTGPLCPVCADEGSGGAPLRSNCQSCDGTGRAGGYYPSQEMYVFIQGAPDATRHMSSNIGSFSPGEKVKGRTIVIGWIETDDVWISEGTGDRYLITAVHPEVVYREYPITYSLEMERLPVGHTQAVNTASVLDKLPAEPSPVCTRRTLSLNDLT